MKEFQRLKKDEDDRLKLEWNFQRTLAKVNYHIHTDAIKENIIPKLLTREEISFAYANEADLLNKALFGKTARQWRIKRRSQSRNLANSNGKQTLVRNIEELNIPYAAVAVDILKKKENLIFLPLYFAGSFAKYGIG